MDKVVERLLIEFLIPALLMFGCILLAADVVMGWIDLSDAQSRRQFLGNSELLIAGILMAYMINTSLSALLNLVSRILWWGKIREYLMYRKLDVFKEPSLHRRRFSWFTYLRDRRKLISKIEHVKKHGAVNLYPVLVKKLEDAHVPPQSTVTILDIYDVVRTLVMASRDSAIIGWIQYHWAQLRLARSTLIPAFILMLLLPLAVVDWGHRSIGAALVAFGCGLVFFLLQLTHYYYRERFMIYAMISYFLIG